MRCLEAQVDSVTGFDAARQEAHTLLIAEAEALDLDLDWPGAHSLSGKVVRDGRWVYEYRLRVPVIDPEPEDDTEEFDDDESVEG